MIYSCRNVEGKGRTTLGRVLNPAWNRTQSMACRDCARRIYTHCPLEVLKEQTEENLVRIDSSKQTKG